MKSTEKHKIWISLLVMLFSGACAGSRIQYSPLRAPDLPPLKKAVILPESQSWETCLNEAKEASYGSAAYSALVLFCSEHLPDTASVNLQIGAALKVLSHLAYDHDYRRFTNRKLAANVDLTTTLEKNATYFFTDNYLVDGARGLGLMPGPSIPLIKRIKHASDGVDSFYPPEGLYEPVALTATTQRSADDRLTVILEQMAFSDKMARYQSIMAEQAYLHLLEAAELDKASWVGFINPHRMTSHNDGIYLIERYDPNRIPILMIHGLRSNPLTWEPLTRAVLSTLDIHERFQVWHAFYPTGLPPFYTGSRIRDVLHKVLFHFDPEGDDLPSRQMAVIGHSMGAVISHMLVSDDDGALWKATFKVQPNELQVDENRREEMENIFSIRHESQIGFVAFIAAPHRGSETADSLIGRMGSSVVKLPLKFTSLFQEDQAYLTQATDAMRPYLSRGGPDSIRVLSPDHPLLKVLAEIPVACGVEHITVIGVEKGPECVRDLRCKATDGVVAYESSKFSPPEDELIIKAGHDVHRHPKAVSFIIERLREWNPERKNLCFQQINWSFSKSR
jgi:pimeloyl-ACP methyl ester carboxylesterase